MILYFIVLISVLFLLIAILLRCASSCGLRTKMSLCLDKTRGLYVSGKVPDYKMVFTYALGFRLFILILAFSMLMLNKGELQNVQDYLEHINLWDARHYVNLIDKGYEGYIEDGQHLFLVFFPGYVWIVRIVKIVIPNTFIAGMLTSSICYALGCCWVHKLILEQYDLDVANNTIIFMSLFPFSFFFGTVMTEGMFLLTTAASIYYATHKKWGAYAVWGILASLTRMSGVLVILVAFLELLKTLEPLYSLEKFKKSILKILGFVPIVMLPSLGTIVYLMLNYYVDGNLFAFVIHQRHWYQGPMPIPNVIKYIVKYLSDNLNNSSGWAIWVPELTIFILCMGILIIVVRRTSNPESLLMYSFSYLILNYSLSWLLSAGRYMSCGFVFFAFLADLTKRREKIRLVIIVLESVLLSMYLFAYLLGAQIM